MTINRLNQGVTNQVLVKAVSGQTTPLLELQDSTGAVVSSIGPTGALGGTLGNSGLVHIKQVSTGGAVASVNVDDVFSADYNTYRIIVDLAASANVGLNLRLRVGGSDTSTGIYRRQVFNVDSTTPSYLRSTTLTSWESIWIADTSTKNSYANNTFEIFNPFEARSTTGSRINAGNPSGNIEMNIAVYGINDTLSYTGFTLLAASGTIDGTITVLGFRK